MFVILTISNLENSHKSRDVTWGWTLLIYFQTLAGQDRVIKFLIQDERKPNRLLYKDVNGPDVPCFRINVAGFLQFSIYVALYHK